MGVSWFLLPVLAAQSVQAAPPVQAVQPVQAAPPAQAAPLRVVSLAEAVQTAKSRQPQLAQARANTAAARARADELRAPILPQLTGTASYQRSTANFVARPGSVPSQFGTREATSLDTFNFFSFGLTLNQYIWDFGQTTGRWKAARAVAEGQAATEHATELQVALGVRTAYFTARAQKSLVQVARENFANQERHLKQAEGFVKVGTRPEIDLAQARTDRANAQVQLINAENAYEVAKAQLNQAMGVEGDTDYDVQDDALAEIGGEEQAREALVEEAVKARPDLMSLERQIAGQKLTLSAVKGGYGPTLGAGMSLTESGTDLTALTWNWSASVNLNWPLFSGLLTYSQTKEANANLAALEAQRSTLRQQVRVEVEQARLQVRAAKASLAAAGEALTNARERLRLAEARYAAGVGNIIEQGDAQVAAANAAAQAVQAEYNLSSARAQLLKALGRLE